MIYIILLNDIICILLNDIICTNDVNAYTQTTNIYNKQLRNHEPTTVSYRYTQTTTLYTVNNCEITN